MRTAHLLSLLLAAVASAHLSADAVQLKFKLQDESGQGIADTVVDVLAKSEGGNWSRWQPLETAQTDGDGNFLCSYRDIRAQEIALRVRSTQWALPLSSPYFEGKKLDARKTDLGKIDCVKGGRFKATFKGDGLTGAWSGYLYLDIGSASPFDERAVIDVNGRGEAKYALPPGEWTVLRATSFRLYDEMKCNIRAGEMTDLGSVKVAPVCRVRVKTNLPAGQHLRLELVATMIDGAIPREPGQMKVKDGVLTYAATAAPDLQGMLSIVDLCPGTWKFSLKLDEEAHTFDLTLPSEDVQTVNFNTVKVPGLTVAVLDHSGEPAPCRIMVAEKGTPAYKFATRCSAGQRVRLLDPDSNGQPFQAAYYGGTTWVSHSHRIQFPPGEYVAIATIEDWVVGVQTVKYAKDAEERIEFTVPRMSIRAQVVHDGKPQAEAGVYLCGPGLGADDSRVSDEGITDVGGVYTFLINTPGIYCVITQRERDWLKQVGWSVSPQWYSQAGAVYIGPGSNQTVTRTTGDAEQPWVKVKLKLPDCPIDPAQAYLAAMDAPNDRVDVYNYSPLIGSSDEYQIDFGPVRRTTYTLALFDAQDKYFAATDIVLGLGADVELEVTVRTFKVTCHLRGEGIVNPQFALHPVFHGRVMNNWNRVSSRAEGGDNDKGHTHELSAVAAGTYMLAAAHQVGDQWVSTYQRVEVKQDLELEVTLGSAEGTLTISVEEPYEESDPFRPARAKFITCKVKDSRGNTVADFVGQYGNYTTFGPIAISGLEPGTYKFRFEGLGVKPQTVTGRIKAGKHETLEVKLKEAPYVIFRCGDDMAQWLPLLESIAPESRSGPVELEAPTDQDKWRLPAVVIYASGHQVFLMNVPQSATQVRIKLRGFKEVVLPVRLKPGHNSLDCADLLKLATG